MATVVLLSGGSGTRLWPLSNEARSKQFLKVLRDKEGNSQSMVQRVVSQIRAATPKTEILVATSASQVSSIQAQVEGQYGIAVEPSRRDTAPAIMLAGSFLHSVRGLSDDEPVVVMPIDSYVEDSYFELVDTLVDAVRKNVSDIVLLGVKPTRPSESYGYIVPDPRSFAEAGAAMRVASFKEKPSREDAERLISEGALWNCGVFAFRLGYIRAITARYTEATLIKALEEYL